MKVKDVIELAEYTGCKIVDFNGKEIEINEEDIDDISDFTVEHIEAKDSIIYIYTFVNMYKNI